MVSGGFIRRIGIAVKLKRFALGVRFNVDDFTYARVDGVPRAVMARESGRVKRSTACAAATASPTSENGLHFSVNSATEFGDVEEPARFEKLFRKGWPLSFGSVRI